jgi:glucan phosphoethanolaminetransferase (alkaline phosphatase superfamily)
MVTACFALYLITLALTGIAFLISFISSCLTSVEESFRITIFGGIVIVNLLAAFTAAGTGALFFYIVKFFMFCGDFCPFAEIRNTSIRCYSGFDTSFALWGIATVLLFCTAFFGSLLKMVDRRQCNEETRALMQKQMDAEDDELNAAREHNHSDQISGQQQQLQQTKSAPTDRNTNETPMNPRTAGGEETDPNSGIGKDVGAELDIPAGYVYQEDSELYWSEDDQLYYDPSSEQYYEPVSGHWYDPKSNTWYTM